MCENIHAVPVSSYFMFVILVLLTLGLIQYGEPQLSFVRALGGFFGVMQAVWCGGNPTVPVACACPRGWRVTQSLLGWEGWWDTQHPGALLGAPQAVLNTQLLSERDCGRGPSELDQQYQRRPQMMSPRTVLMSNKIPLLLIQWCLCGGACDNTRAGMGWSLKSI